MCKQRNKTMKRPKDGEKARLVRWESQDQEPVVVSALGFPGASLYPELLLKKLATWKC